MILMGIVREIICTRDRDSLWTHSRSGAHERGSIVVVMAARRMQGNAPSLVTKREGSTAVPMNILAIVVDAAHLWRIGRVFKRVRRHALLDTGQPMFTAALAPPPTEHKDKATSYSTGNNAHDNKYAGRCSVVPEKPGYRDLVFSAEACRICDNVCKRDKFTIWSSGGTQDSHHCGGRETDSPVIRVDD